LYDALANAEIVFMVEFPGTENAAYLSFCILDRLTDLLIRKGIITDAEMVTLLNELASDLSQDRGRLAERNVGYVRDTLIAKHQRFK
jgi:hypothetical protein